MQGPYINMIWSFTWIRFIRSKKTWIRFAHILNFNQNLTVIEIFFIFVIFGDLIVVRAVCGDR